MRFVTLDWYSLSREWLLDRCLKLLPLLLLMGTCSQENAGVIPRRLKKIFRKFRTEAAQPNEGLQLQRRTNPCFLSRSGWFSARAKQTERDSSSSCVQVGGTMQTYASSQENAGVTPRRLKERFRKNFERKRRNQTKGYNCSAVPTLASCPSYKYNSPQHFHRENCPCQGRSSGGMDGHTEGSKERVTLWMYRQSSYFSFS